MSEVILYIAASLDGYIADPQGGVSWLEPFEQTGEDYGYEAFYRRLDTLIMGRKTYRQVLTFGQWPYEGVKTYVLTRQAEPPPPENQIEWYAGSLPELVRRLKSSSQKDIWLVGGAQVVDAFLRDDLIDELILSVIPVLLGDGIPLFKTGTRQRPLKLTASRDYPDGIVQLTYRL